MLDIRTLLASHRGMNFMMVPVLFRKQKLLLLMLLRTWLTEFSRAEIVILFSMFISPTENFSKQVFISQVSNELLQIIHVMFW